MTYKPAPLLPKDNAKNNPLFIILAILAFLASLSLLSFKTGHVAAHQWKTDLKQTASVQIKPGSDFDAGKVLIAKQILLTSPNISTAQVLSQEASKDLLKPWLGEVALPDDLPLPILIHIQLRPGKMLDTGVLQTSFANAGIDADIDDHLQWTKVLNAKVHAFQLLALFAFLLITVAVLAACIFAVRAGILGQKKLMNILHQIGADPRYTARIFSTKFSMTSFRAGVLGSFGAFSLLFLLGLMLGDGNGDSLLPNFNIGFYDMALAIFVPLFMGLISGLVTWYTVTKSLNDKVYS